MMRRVLYLVVALLLSLSAAAGPLRHEYHVAITQLDYNSATRSVEITSKIFVDDLERAFEQHGGKGLRIGDATEAPGTDNLIHQYFQFQFQVYIDGRACVLRWVGKELEGDVLWCYLEIKDIDRVELVDITCKLLTEVYEDQSNIVHIQVGGQRKSLMLDRNKLAGTANF